MPNENDWNRNRRSSNWDDNDNNYSRNRNSDYENNYDDRRQDRGYENRSSYGNSSGNRDYGNMTGSNYGGRNYDEDRYSSDNDYSRNRGVYGNSTGVNRGSSSYLGRNEGDYNRGSRGYSGSNYGSYNSDRYSGDRNRGDDRDWWDKTKDEVSSWFGDDEAARRRRMDEMRAGQHKGKGPKGYKRSDERIKEDVNDKLSDDSHIDASDIDVTVENGEVTLTGTVSNRWEKRHAEDIVEALSGVKNVENRLKVSSSNNSGTYGSSGSTGSTGSTGNTGTGFGSTYGSSGAAPVGAFDTGKS